MTAPIPPATVPFPPPEPIAAAPPAPEKKPQLADRRRHDFWSNRQREANTVFLFFMNPVLDPDTNRISGTRLLAWIIVWVNTLDIIDSHSLKELAITKGVNDSISWKNVALYGLAFLIWFGPKGMDWGVCLVKAWKGRND